MCPLSVSETLQSQYKYMYYESKPVTISSNLLKILILNNL